jgi:hypothetical protein
VSERTILNLENPGVTRPTLEAIAAALDVPPDTIAVLVTLPGDMQRFYPLVALRAAAPASLPDGGRYQDWAQDGDDQAVAYLWAEAVGSSIHAEVLPPKEKKKREKGNEAPRFLRVSFKNVKDSYPGNVAIHPQGMRAVAAAEKRSLVFQARLARREDPGCEPSAIGIAVRVRDARLEQWQYRLDHENFLLEDIEEEAPEWQPFEVDLTAGSRKWKKLSMEPVVQNETPDFSVVTGIVFEFGQRARLRRPGMGHGTVEIGDIFLK